MKSTTKKTKTQTKSSNDVSNEPKKVEATKTESKKDADTKSEPTKSEPKKVESKSTINVNVKLLNENAVVPSYETDGDAGMDVTATHIISNTDTQITYGTGLAMEIPKGYVGLIFPRSSIRKTDLTLSNSVGVIDSGYRGEIQATFKKPMWDCNVYKINDRVMQIIIVPYPQIKFNLVNKLSDSDRGQGGFGSTGA